jgi:YD repeat-containing protein
MSADTTRRYAVTVIYTAEPVIEVEADSIEEAQYLALREADATAIETTYDGAGQPTAHGRATEVVTVAGRELRMRLTSWYAAPIPDSERTRT